MMKAEEYLKQNVRGILQPMVSAVLLEKPKDPLIYHLYLILCDIFRYYL